MLDQSPQFSIGGNEIGLEKIVKPLPEYRKNLENSERTPFKISKV